MSENPQFMEAFIDLRPNQPKTEQARESFKRVLRALFEERLPEAVERVWDLPPIIVKPEGKYLALLEEARELYVEGRFYSCVAMCGIVGERLVKDLLRACVLVQRDGPPRRPPTSSFDQFERVEVRGIVRFLEEAGLLAKEGAKAAGDLGELRNAYSHARGKNPSGDALEAIQLLHKLVEDTVSLFKEFEIKDGAFVPKARSTP